MPLIYVSRSTLVDLSKAFARVLAAPATAYPETGANGTNDRKEDRRDPSKKEAQVTDRLTPRLFFRRIFPKLYEI
jgi:hypothetical protein